MFELKTYRRGTSPVVHCDTSTREACVHENSVQAVDKNSNRGRASDRTFPTQYFHTSPRQWLGSRRHLMCNLLSHTELISNNCAHLSTRCRGAWGRCVLSVLGGLHQHVQCLHHMILCVPPSFHFVSICDVVSSVRKKLKYRLTHPRLTTTLHDFLTQWPSHPGLLWFQISVGTLLHGTRCAVRQHGCHRARHHNWCCFDAVGFAFTLWHKCISSSAVFFICFFLVGKSSLLHAESDSTIVCVCVCVFAVVPNMLIGIHLCGQVGENQHEWSCVVVCVRARNDHV